MIPLGGPVLEKHDDPRELARRHKELGYTAAYAPRVDLNDACLIDSVRNAFAAEQIIIAEAGAWSNMLAVDEAERRANHEKVCNTLAMADALGARCCVNYIGTLAKNSCFGPHPDNLTAATFDLAVETVRKIIDAVRPKRAKFCLEMMQWTLPDSVDAYLALLRSVDRKAFGVHMDPANIVVSPRIYYDTGGLIRDCFKRLGHLMVSCHAKDLILRDQLALHFDEVRPGLGNLDYNAYISELCNMRHPPPLMLEHLATAEEYALALKHLRAIEQSVQQSKTMSQS